MKNRSQNENIKFFIKFPIYSCDLIHNNPDGPGYNARLVNLLFILLLTTGPFPDLLHSFEKDYPGALTTFYEENGLYKPLGEQPSLGFDGGQIRYKNYSMIFL